MASNQKKGISYYVRLDKGTFQGKLTRLFMLVALLMLIILLVFNYIFDSYHKEQQYIANTLQPSINHVQNLSNLLEFTDNLESKSTKDKLNKLLSNLNTLSNTWEEESYTVYYQQVLDKLESVEKLAKEGDWKASEDYSYLKKNLNRLQASLEDKYNTINQYHIAIAKNIDTCLIISYIIYFLFGVFIAHLVVKNIIYKIRDVRHTIRNLAKGIIPDSINESDDEFASTKRELMVLTSNLKSLTHFAKEVGHGNFNASLDVFDKEGALGKSLAEMRDSLKNVSEEQMIRRWFNEGIAKFSDILRTNNKDIDALAQEVISPLVKYLGALKGAIFVLEEDPADHRKYLKMRACYAYDRIKYFDKKIPAENGLIGQAYLEREQIHLTEIPEDYESIVTGLGDGSPKSLIIMPLIENGNIVGVLEIASLNKFEKHHIEFLEKTAENIAATINTVKNNEKTQALLKEAQMAAEQLGAQEEEMRQNMEEMEATQEEMSRTQRELSIKSANLNALINNTTDSIITITRDYKVGIINDVQKDRYKGTPFESIDTGTDLLATLGSVADEWKGYYDRAFAGERLNFVIKSSVKGEDAWREYFINPIKSDKNEIVGASVLSRNITEKMRFEILMKKKTAILNAILEHTAQAYVAVDENYKVLVANPLISKFSIFQEVLKPEVKILEAVKDDFTAEWKSMLEQAFADKKESTTYNMAGKGAFTIYFNPVKDDKDKIVAILIAANQLQEA